ncbi:MAG TPA: glutamyl-tRNA reductase [Casimicrobiaceae bacterium]|nr:glutamyl-tRNA reductase [Casimicrobiaceae bacterium]
MAIYTLGLNHTTASLDVRERVAFGRDVVADALRDLTGGRHAREAAIVSTCNRTEVYFLGDEPQPVAQWLERFHNLPQGSLAPHLYTLPHDQAVKHAFRVASGLDSVVLGEPQILGQMKQAVREAQAAGSLGLVLNRLFQRTFAVAKDVRSNTDIGSASISMAAAAVKLAERIFPSLTEQRLLLIGAGEMIELAATHFMSRHPQTVTVANRTLGRGEALANRFDAATITLAEVPDKLSQFDIVVTCTASTLPILGKGLLERAMRERKHAPMLIVDLAVPRDVEPEAEALADIFLYSVDDLAEIVKGNLNIRRESVDVAERMIAEQVRHFLLWLEGRSVVPTISALSAHHDALRVAELDRAKRMLSSGAAPDAVLEVLARGLTSKLLHAPLSALNQAGDAERAELIALLQHVYKLPDPPEPPETPASEH